MKKVKKWINKRHQRVYRLFAPFFSRILAKKGYYFERYELDSRPHLIISNHLTRMDQYMMCLLFGKMLYFVARDDLFSSRAFSRFLEYTCAPIPKSKVSKDISTIRNCEQVAREGGNIALFPEGNLSFDGALGTIEVSTAKLIKLLKLPLVFVRNEGGYGSMPRWSAKSRRGSFTMRVTDQIEYEQYKDMSPEQLLELIIDKLSVNNLNLPATYSSNQSAERLELLLYVCPHCGFTRFVSNGKILRCTKCNNVWKYRDDLRFTPATPFAETISWQKYQNDFLTSADITDVSTPVYVEKVKWLKLEIANKYKKVIFSNPTLHLYFDRFVFTKGNKEAVYRFDDVQSVAVLGRNKIEFNSNGNKLFIMPDKYTNGLKYMQFFYRYLFEKKGLTNSRFGL